MTAIISAGSGSVPENQPGRRIESAPVNAVADLDRGEPDEDPEEAVVTSGPLFVSCREILTARQSRAPSTMRGLSPANRSIAAGSSMRPSVRLPKPWLSM